MIRRIYLPGTVRLDFESKRAPLRARLLTFRVVRKRRAFSAHMTLEWPPHAWLNDKHKIEEGPWT